MIRVGRFAVENVGVRRRYCRVLVDHGLARTTFRQVSTTPPQNSAEKTPQSFIQRVAAEGSEALVGRFTHRGGFDSCLDGLEVTHQSPGLVKGSFEVTRPLQNSYSTLHGGAIATIVDVVGTMALLTKDHTRAGVSVELNTAYLNAAAGGDKVLVEGTVAKYGRKLGFAEVELTSATTGKCIAKGRHTKFFT